MAWSSRGLDRRFNSRHDQRFFRRPSSRWRLSNVGGRLVAQSRERPDSLLDPRHPDVRIERSMARAEYGLRAFAEIFVGPPVVSTPDAVAIAERAAVACLAEPLSRRSPLSRPADSSCAGRASAPASSAPWDAAADGLPAVCCRVARHGVHRSCRSVTPECGRREPNSRATAGGCGR